MGSKIMPEDNRVPLLLKPLPFSEKIPIPILITPAVDVAEMGPRKFPVNLVVGSEVGVEASPKGEWMDAVVEASNRRDQKGYYGKMGSVIPKKRRLVKTMVYESIKEFVISLFRTPPSGDDGVGAQP